MGESCQCMKGRTWRQTTLQGVQKIPVDWDVITISFKPLPLMSYGDDTLKEMIFVLSALLNYTQFCHHDVSVIKWCETPPASTSDRQLLTCSTGKCLAGVCTSVLWLAFKSYALLPLSSGCSPKCNVYTKLYWCKYIILPREFPPTAGCGPHRSQPSMWKMGGGG